MPDQVKPQLTCAACGVRPTEPEARYTARLNGTHWRKLTHAAGIPGREQGGKVRSCGPWVEATATREEREQAVCEWEAKKGEVTR